MLTTQPLMVFQPQGQLRIPGLGLSRGWLARVISKDLHTAIYAASGQILATHMDESWRFANILPFVD